ncbi:MAG: hypothetical protein ACREIT_05005 [Tepidisphaeraceae bacterium]
MTTHPCSIWLSLFLLCIAPLAASAADSPARQYLAAATKACGDVERRLPEITRVAEVVADRYLAGGFLGFPRVAWYVGHGLEEELCGRSGQIVHIGFDRGWKPDADRTDVERKNDVVIAGWRKDPHPEDIDLLKQHKARGGYLIGFGPGGLPALAEHVKVCDAWFDTGLGTDDRVVAMPDGSRAGRLNTLSNVVTAWALMGETIAACTRRGKMPIVAKSFCYEDGREWWDRYFQKMPFHEDFQIAPIPAGQMGKAYVRCVRDLVHKFERTQLDAVDKTAGLIVKELGDGRKTLVVAAGHLPWAYAAKDEAVAWAIAPATGLQHDLPGKVEIYNRDTPDGALVLRLGYAGHHKADHDILRKKKQRVMLITSEDPRPEFQLPDDLLTIIDMGFAFGDACVAIEGYLIRALPPSGVTQIVAYEAVNVEVLSRIAGLGQ